MAKSKSLGVESKKRKAEDVETVADDHPTVDPAESLKKKKKKKSADDSAPAQDPVPLETQIESPPKRKKGRTKTFGMVYVWLSRQISRLGRACP